MVAISRCVRMAWSLALACWLGLAGAQAQAQPEAAAPQVFSQQELDQMLAPIALYPDGLLAQVLMAATYPPEVVQAQRWAQANPTLSGAEALGAVEPMAWDPSVKSLVAFPAVLQTMGQQLDWTRRLGDAFLGQQARVMDTVQALRHKAYAAGHLASTAQEQVIVEGDTIRIEPVNPQVAYVPYYNPTVVYGPWWWAGYPPVYWDPWPAYALGAGVLIGADFWFGGFDWAHHHADVNYTHFHDRFFHHPDGGWGAWQHNPYHRQGVVPQRPAGGQFRGDWRGSPPAGWARPAPLPDLTHPRGLENRGPSAAPVPQQPSWGCPNPPDCGAGGGARQRRAPGGEHERQPQRR